MTKRERIGSVGFGMMCAATVGLMVKHLVSPDMVTAAAVNAIAVSASVFIGYTAYDSFKEGLTGRRQ
jgi:ABC-type uncharacterized transport system permease subunit